MKIEIYTKSGQALIAKIFKSVEDESVETWKIRKDKDGNRYLTHKPEQWYDKALFKFDNDDEKIIITFACLKDKELNEDIKGYYIGRLTELLLVHFKNDFGKFEIIK